MKAVRKQGGSAVKRKTEITIRLNALSILSLLIEPQWQIPDNFRESQENDPSLKPLFSKACKVDGDEDASTGGLKNLIGDPFIIKDNLLYLADRET